MRLPDLKSEDYCRSTEDLFGKEGQPNVLAQLFIEEFNNANNMSGRFQLRLDDLRRAHEFDFVGMSFVTRGIISEFLTPLEEAAIDAVIQSQQESEDRAQLISLIKSTAEKIREELWHATDAELHGQDFSSEV